jgi:hypothetical protein
VSFLHPIEGVVLPVLPGFCRLSALYLPKAVQTKSSFRSPGDHPAIDQPST